ncbi:hypothetical protein D9758_007743 [Tetrapyrgos nigripes]|uniref:Uncharacterized protein n=1 Tax=Tetrapyrgos nigripes TaxID=182062 RepID=A0A8H5LIR6_9AGAR|nr:hypothetical protein D9758_007743 [Tetrapyrgos nigripes]
MVGANLELLLYFLIQYLHLFNQSFRINVKCNDNHALPCSFPDLTDCEIGDWDEGETLVQEDEDADEHKQVKRPRSSLTPEDVSGKLRDSYATATASQLHKELLSVRQQNHRLEQALKDKDSNFREMTKKLDELKQAHVRQLNEQRRQHAAELGRMEQSSKVLRDQLSGYILGYDERGQELEETTSQCIDEIERMTMKCGEEIKGLTMQCGEEIERLTMRCNEEEKLTRKYSEEIKRLMTELENEKSRHVETHQEREGFRRLVDSRLEEIKRLTTQLESEKSQHAETGQEREDFRRLADSHLAAMEENERSFRKRTKQLQSQVLELQQELQGAKEQTVSTRNELNVVRAEMGQKEERWATELASSQGAADDMKVWLHATIEQEKICRQKDKRFLETRWTDETARQRIKLMAEDFWPMNYSMKTRPLTMLSIPWPVLDHPYSLDWSSLEYSSAVKKYFEKTQPQGHLKKLLHIFHPDKWVAPLKTVIDDDLRTLIDTGVNDVFKVISDVRDKSGGQ